MENKRMSHRKYFCFWLCLLFVLLVPSCGSEKESSQETITNIENLENPIQTEEPKSEDESDTSTESWDSQSIQSVFEKLNCDRRKILDVATTDDENAIVLYYNTDAKNENEILSVYYYNINSDELKDTGLFFGDLMSFTNSKNGEIPKCRFLSINPLLVSDEEAKIVYSIDNKKVSTIQIKESENLEKIFYLNSSLYALTIDGRIILINENGIETIWKRPDNWPEIDFVTTDNSETIILSIDRNDLWATGDVYIKLNVLKGAEKIYSVPYRTVQPRCVDEGKEICIDTRNNRYAQLVSPDLAVQQKINVNKNDVGVNSLLDCSVEPLVGRLLILYAREKTGAISNVFLVNTTLYSDKKWESPKEEPYVIRTNDWNGVDEYAKDIEEKYDIRIVYKDLPEKKIHYYITQDNKINHIYKMLDGLSATLDNYPDGFFRELKKGWIDELTFYITYDLEGDDSTYFKIVNGVAGYVSDYGTGIILLKSRWIENGYEDGPESYKATIVHEISHIIDQRVARDNKSFESEWIKMNPKGFSYSEKYYSADGVVQDREYTTFKGIESAYFINSYAKTAATEDRAVLWEYLMRDDKAKMCYKGPIIRQKVEFYFQQVRKCLETDAWPEETDWERRLRESGQ